MRGGLDYLIKVRAAYTNGYTAWSSVATIRACAAPALPVGAEWLPEVTATTTTSISLRWLSPAARIPLSQGCHLTGYRVYMSRDAGATFSEIDSAAVAGKPDLHSHIVLSSNFDAGGADIGRSFLFQLRAENVVGSLPSASVAAPLASPPGAPAAAPASVPAKTTASQIGYQLTVVNAATLSETGGAPILSYSLEVDDGEGGSFAPLYGVLSPSLLTEYLL